MTEKLTRYLLAGALFFAVYACAQTSSSHTLPSTPDDSQVRPPVTKSDLEIVKRAQAILNSPALWNRSDNRKCPEDAKTFSLYCALELATKEVTGDFAHRGAAMQEARFVIDDIAPNAKSYHHRLMDYNNDPTTTFADVQKFFRILEERISKDLKQEPSK